MHVTPGIELKETGIDFEAFFFNKLIVVYNKLLHKLKVKL